MKKFISSRFASSALLLIFSLVIIFHVLVIVGIIPFTMVWGGRIQSQEQMISFEMASILLNVVMLMVVVIYSRFVKVSLNPMIIKVALWIMFALFFLNTIGNLFSISELEKIIFTPITFLLAIFSLRLALDK